jgi:hypothetical protein
VGDGHTARISLVPDDIRVNVVKEFTVWSDDLPRATFKLAENERIVEILLQNLPDPVGPDGDLRDMDVTPLLSADGSAVFSFIGDDLTAAHDLTNHALRIRSPKTDHELGAILYDDEGDPIAILISDY